MQFWLCGLFPKNFPLHLVDEHVYKYCEMNSSCCVKSSCKFYLFAILVRAHFYVIWCKTRRHTPGVVSIIYFTVHFWHISVMSLHPGGDNSVFCQNLSWKHMFPVCKDGPAVIRTAMLFDSLWSQSPTEPTGVSVLSGEDKKPLPHCFLAIFFQIKP